MTALTRQRDAARSRQIGTDPAEHWRDRAACRDEDPELFFPPGEFGAGPVKPAILAQIAAAKAVCASCPATAECLAYARDSGEDWGIWGGLTRYERRRGKQTPDRICQHCGKPYTGRGDRYCTPTCDKAARRANCGTPAAAARHRQHGEPVDHLCRLAESLYRANLRAKRKERATA